MAKFSSSLSGVVVLQPGYDAYTDGAGTVLAAVDGDAIAALKSGAFNFQATSTAKPTFKTGLATINGVSYPIVRTDGVANILKDTAVTVGTDFTALMVGKWRKRVIGNLVLAGITNSYNVYLSNTNFAHYSFYDGVGEIDCGADDSSQEMGGTDFFALQGVTKIGTALRVVRDNFSGTATCTEISAGTGMSLGAAYTPGATWAQLDAVMFLLVPTAGLTSGNLTTLRGELAAYFGSDPLPVGTGKTLVVWEGNSLLSAGSNASLVANEQQRIAEAALTGESVDIRSFGAAGNTTNDISLRATYDDGYPASVGRTKANSVLVVGEGYNDSSATAAFISYINARVAAGWGRVIIMLPCYTSGWGGAGGDAGVTTWYTTIKGTSFAANVTFADYRGGGFGASYDAGDFTDSVHWNDTGHAKAGAIIAVPLQAAVAVVAYPTITVQPVGSTVTAGSPFSVSVTATVPSGGSLSYQWRKGGVNIGGATSATYTNSTPVVADSGSYDCVVTNSSVSSVTSDAVTVTVNAAITTIPGQCDECYTITLNINLNLCPCP